jgi:hypothetical protein
MPRRGTKRLGNSFVIAGVIRDIPRKIEVYVSPADSKTMYVFEITLTEWEYLQRTITTLLSQPNLSVIK